MNSRAAMMILVLFLITLAMLEASEPWSQTSYLEWTAEDVNKVLHKSPWAHPVNMDIGVAPSRQLGPITPPQGVPPPSDMPRSPNNPNPPPGSQDRNRPYGPDSNSRFALTQVVVVQWASSLTVREAQARQAELEGKLTTEAAGQILARAPEHYKISVVSEHMPETLLCVNPEEVRNSAYLQTERGKRKISAERVEFLEKNDGRTVIMEVYFPREAGGESLIGLAENKVKFYCRLGTTTVKTEFHLDKMIRQGQRDL
jgi:hypothetical protein